MFGFTWHSLCPSSSLQLKRVLLQSNYNKGFSFVVCVELLSNTTCVQNGPLVILNQVHQSVHFTRKPNHLLCALYYKKALENDI